MADFVTRFAEAHREVALAAGEPSTYRGFPPSTAHMITSFASGPGPALEHLAISPPFSAFLSPDPTWKSRLPIFCAAFSTAISFWIARLQNADAFPAIDLLRSVSRRFAGSGQMSDENALIQLARQRLGTYDRSEMMIHAGLYSAGTDAGIDAAIEAYPKLDQFLSESERDDVSASFARLAECVEAPDKDQPN